MKNLTKTIYFMIIVLGTISCNPNNVCEKEIRPDPEMGKLVLEDLDGLWVNEYTTLGDKVGDNINACDQLGIDGANIDFTFDSYNSKIQLLYNCGAALGLKPYREFEFSEVGQVITLKLPTFNVKFKIVDFVIIDSEHKTMDLEIIDNGGSAFRGGVIYSLSSQD